MSIVLGVMTILGGLLVFVFLLGCVYLIILNIDVVLEALFGLFFWACIIMFIKWLIV